MYRVQGHSLPIGYMLVGLIAGMAVEFVANLALEHPWLRWER